MGDLFVLGWARVRRESISSELQMSGGGMRTILLLSLVARCLETIDVCTWVRGLGLGFTNPGGTGGKWDICLFWVAVMWVVLGAASARVSDSRVLLSLCLL